MTYFLKLGTRRLANYMSLLFWKAMDECVWAILVFAVTYCPTLN